MWHGPSESALVPDLAFAAPSTTVGQRSGGVKTDTVVRFAGLGSSSRSPISDHSILCCSEPVYDWRRPPSTGSEDGTSGTRLSGGPPVKNRPELLATASLISGKTSSAADGLDTVEPGKGLRPLKSPRTSLKKAGAWLGCFRRLVHAPAFPGGITSTPWPGGHVAISHIMTAWIGQARPGPRSIPDHYSIPRCSSRPLPAILPISCREPPRSTRNV